MSYLKVNTKIILLYYMLLKNNKYSLNILQCRHKKYKTLKFNK